MLNSNFDSEYTQLPIQIDPIEEELIRIQDPIQLYKSQKKRGHSFCFGSNRTKNNKRRSVSYLNKKARVAKKGKSGRDLRKTLNNRGKTKTSKIKQSDPLHLTVAALDEMVRPYSKIT